MNEMEAMPPIDYSQLATKRDLDALGAELRGEMAELRGDMHQLNATTVRATVAGNLVTIGVLGAWITAAT